MRFLVDESTGPRVAEWLDGQGHDVVSIYHTARGVDDEVVLQMAYDDDRILITNDRDFGEKVYREHKSHRGTILLRLADERAPVKIDVLQRLLENYSDRLANQFVVVTETRVRFAKE
jgi:predicted nuclease of predicted toxin-antitoxin system